MKTIKIWSALILLMVSIGLLKFAYSTSNWHLAITAMILGALFVLAGLGMATDRDEPDYEKQMQELENLKHEALQKNLQLRDELRGRAVSFKAKLASEEKRITLNLADTSRTNMFADVAKPKVARKAANKK